MATSRKSFSNFYKIFRSLSFDIVFGVAAVSLFASRLLNVVAQPVWILVLLLATWSFYTLDHLLDGLKNKETSSIFRHYFHYNYRRSLFFATAITGSAALILSILFLDRIIIKLGFLLASLVLIYFLAIRLVAGKQSNLLQKELIIAIIYTAGIWIAPFAWSGFVCNTFATIVIVVLFLLAWAEGVMASYFDYKNDLKDKHTSFTVVFGKQNTRSFLITLHILVFILIKISVFFVSTNTQFAVMIILAIMNLSLLLIILYPQTFEKNEKYRIFGEMVFWLPILILLTDLF